MSEPVLHIAINHANGKWCVYALIGACETADEAKKLTEEWGPQIGALFGLDKRKR